MRDASVMVGEFECDHVIVICQGCKGERQVYPDRPLRRVEEVLEWIKTEPTGCVCGATHCDLKMHLRPTPTGADEGKENVNG